MLDLLSRVLGLKRVRWSAKSSVRFLPRCAQRLTLITSADPTYSLIGGLCAKLGRHYSTAALQYCWGLLSAFMGSLFECNGYAPS